MARAPMNRIQELREAAGLTQEELAKRLGTDAQQVGRHERGDRRLTIQWMARYAMALSVAPADLMVAPEVTSPAAEIEEETVGIPSLSGALALRGLRLYRVLVSMVPDAGIAVGDHITVDQTPEALAKIQAGDVVVARPEPGEALMLRQFLPPALLVTNMPGARNTALRLDDRSARLVLVGVVIKA